VRERRLIGANDGPHGRLNFIQCGTAKQGFDSSEGANVSSFGNDWGPGRAAPRTRSFTANHQGRRCGMPKGGVPLHGCLLLPFVAEFVAHETFPVLQCHPLSGHAKYLP
jgi:hypothetical protein